MLATEFGCYAHIQLVIVAFENYLQVNICTELQKQETLKLTGF
jgi:hypothetical protein